MTQISANELRIGNYLQTPVRKKVITVDIRFIRMIRNNPDIFIGIPITPEWLERFGLITDKTDNVITLYENDCFSLRCSCYPEHRFQVWFESDYHESSINIEFVHQLQNLYHALTGTELILKP